MTADDGVGDVIGRMAAALAGSVKGGAAEAGATTGAELLRGTVVSHAGSLAVVTTDGATHRTNVPWLSSYSIADNDDVWVVRYGSLLLIIGKSA